MHAAIVLRLAVLLFVIAAVGACRTGPGGTARIPPANTGAHVAPAGPLLVTESRHSFVVHVGDASYVVLEDAPVDALGEAEQLPPSSLASWVLRRPVGFQHQEIERARVMYAAVNLVTASGELCTTAVTKLWEMAGVSPHASTDAAWLQAIEQAGRLPPKVTEEVYREGATFLAAELAPSPCLGEAVWAVTTEQPVVIWEKVEAPFALEAARLLPEWQQMQADYEAAGGVEDHLVMGDAWDASAEVRAFREPDTGRELAFVRATRGEPCGGFMGTLSAIFEVTRAPGAGGEAADAFTLLSVEEELPLPESVADLDGDGIPELFAPHALLRSENGAYAPSNVLALPNHDEGC